MSWLSLVAISTCDSIVFPLSDIPIFLKNTALSSSSSSNLIKAFDKENGNSLSYKDVEVTCIVLADSIENNNLKNIAEVKRDSNSEGKGDRDSTPDNDKENEDDIDKEYLKLKYFDLSLLKLYLPSKRG